MSELKDFYLVKWKNTEHPEIPVKNWFGIVRTYAFDKTLNKQIQDAWAKGYVAVDDCIFNICTLRKLSDVIQVKFGSDSEEDLFHSTVYKHYEDKEPSKFGVGSMFSIEIADGRATYLITKVNKTSVKIEWFGAHNLDRYIDHHFGWGGTFPINNIKRYVEADYAMKKLFSRK
jgi:hypothetical protein